MFNFLIMFNRLIKGVFTTTYTPYTIRLELNKNNFTANCTGPTFTVNPIKKCLQQPKNYLKI